MLAQLAVFAGGFSVAAVEAIVDLSSIPDHPWPLDVLQSLVDKSLVRIAGGERFDLLESIREYAAEQLERFGGMTNSFGVTRDQTERRHGTYFAAMGSIGAREKSGAEIENVVAACKRAAARLDEKCAVDALTSAWGALKLRGPFRTGAELGSAVASIPALSAGLAVVANIIKGKALMASGAMREARPCILLAVSTATALGDVAHLCRARESLAELLANEGDVAEAVSTYVKALSDAGQIGDLPLEWNLLSGLATCYEYLGQFDNARIHYERSLAIAHELGDIRLIGGSLGNMGQLNANRGRNAEAQSYYQRAIEIAVQLGDRQWEGNVRCNLGLLHAAEGRNTQARKELEAALVGARELGHVKLECVALCNLGITHEAESDLQAARRCYEDAVRIARSLADKRSEGQFLGYLGHLLGRESQFDSAVELLDRGESLLRAVGDSASLGLLHCQRAQTEYLKGDAGRALIALVEAEALARDIGPDSQSEFGVALAHTRHLLRR